MSDQKQHQVLIFMGVCGCGKSTVGKIVAERLGLKFYEGDEFHSEANVEKMRSGTPLDDDDRAPWLADMADAISNWIENGEGGVLSCSALKQKYRKVLRGEFGVAGPVRIIHLHGTEALIDGRLKLRQNHYMPPGLLASQLTTLEIPGADEKVIEVEVSASPEELAAQVLRELGGV